MEHRLVLYPTARTIRATIDRNIESNGFLPTFMRIDEFERRCVILPELVLVDNIYRIILLQEASKFSDFEKLKVDKELLKFFSKSDAFFKFFEELSAEGVNFDELKSADAYVEFNEHLNILEKLRDNYERILSEKGLTDRAFIPKNYRINRAFIETYTQFELHIEGYLSQYELSIISEVASEKSFIIHIRTSKFNQKMIDRFSELGVDLALDKYISFDLHTKEIISKRDIKENIETKVYRCEERLEQVALAIETIDKFVKDGIPPEDIVLILPDEEMQEQFKAYDKMGNFNFAMGFSYIHKRVYKRLDALYRYWQSYDDKDFGLLVSYNMSELDILKMPSAKSTINNFFTLLERLELFDSEDEDTLQPYRYFLKIFPDREMPIKNWLYIWLQILSDITIDDVSGGKITVMGVLESRGVSYRGVVIVDVNEGIVPVTSSKDRFLNTALRANAKLPTKSDRESLQKYFYQRLLEEAERSVIYYSASDNTLPSKFIYELGLNNIIISKAELNILYYNTSKLLDERLEPIVERFNAQEYIWSPTMLKVFLDCKRKFFYRYIKKLQVPKEREINQGAVIHELLYRLFKESSSFNNTQELNHNFIKILSEYQNELKDIKYDYYSILWRERLQRFFNSQIEHFNSGWSIYKLEYEITGEIDGLKFKGRVDRLDAKSDNLMVIDYKTGSTTEANGKKLDNITDFQMSIYNNILKQKRDIKNIELVFIKVLDDGEYEYLNNIDDKDEILLSQIRELKDMNTFMTLKCDNLSNCKYCDYKLNCRRDIYS